MEEITSDQGEITPVETVVEIDHDNDSVEVKIALPPLSHTPWIKIEEQRMKVLKN